MGVPFLVAGIFGMMIGPNVNVSADEPTVASGAGVTIETPAETPLGAAVITSAKKAYSLKQVTITWTQSGEAQSAVIFRKKAGKVILQKLRGFRMVRREIKRMGQVGESRKNLLYQVCVFRTRADGTTQVQTEAKTASVKLVPGKIKGLKAKKKRKKNCGNLEENKKCFRLSGLYESVCKGIKTKYSRAKTQKGRATSAACLFTA